MSKNYNEKTRVQMPAMVHLARLGYNYIGKMYEENAGETFDSETNILIDKFHSAFERLNPSKKGDWLAVFTDIKIEYVDITEEEFNSQMKADMEELNAMFEESHNLEEEIQKQLASLKYVK